MPTYTFPIEETEDTVIRPMTTSLISRVLAESSLDTDNIPVYLMGDYGNIPQAKSTLDEGVDKHRLASNTRCEITVTEEFLGNNTTPELYSEHTPVFVEPLLDMYIKPVYIQCKNTVTVQLYCRSRVEAKKWQKSIQSRVNRSAFASVSAAKYYYPIPNEIVYILGTIHTMREKVAGYNDSMGNWIRKHFTDRLDVISNQKGEGLQFIINETQGRIVGHYDFDYEVSKPEKQDSGAYLIEFSYTYTYDQPQSMIIHFPIVIHNQIIPPSIRDESIFGDDEPDGFYLTDSGYAFHNFAFNSQTSIPYSKYYTGEPIPRYDDWFPRYRRERYESMLRVACAVSLTDPTWVATIDEDIYPHSFPAATVNYMRTRPMGMMVMYESIFFITVHRWHHLMSNDDMSIGADLKLMIFEPLDLRDMYHVCIDLLTDISALSDEALDHLTQHPGVYDDYVQTYYPDTPLVNPPRYPRDPDTVDDDHTGGGGNTGGTGNGSGSGDGNGEDGEGNDNGGNNGGTGNGGNTTDTVYNPEDIREIIEGMDDEDFLFRTRKKKMMLVNIAGITAHRSEDLRKR